MELNYEDPNPLVATVARLFAKEGKAKEVATIAHATPQIMQTGYDNWGDRGTCEFNLILQVPHFLFSQLEPELENIQNNIREKAQLVLRAYPYDYLQEVIITPLLSANEGWQEKAKSWLAGKNLSNQGRVRSDNVAPKNCDGLLFRSQAEINLYKALKALGITFAPLPVFLKGGDNYIRIEPDFILIKDGIIMVVEVDGDTVHNETPTEAHTRTKILIHEGAHIERVNANECASTEAAKNCAKQLLQVLSKLKSART
ncbi:MAG: hypothetical protein ACLFV6_01000 [Spirulinaceae cyanobacterium]